MTSASSSASPSAATASSGSCTRPSLPDRLHGQPLLEDPAVAHADAPVGAPGGRQVVGHHHDRHAELAVHGAERLQHAVGRHGVQLRGGLVGQQQHRGVRQRHRDRGALLFAAGELPDLVVRPVGQVHQREELVGAPAPIRCEPRVQHAGQPDVLAHGQVWDQVPGRSLPHEPHALGAIRRERRRRSGAPGPVRRRPRRRRTRGPGRPAGSGSWTCPRRSVRRRPGTRHAGRPGRRRRARPRRCRRSGTP